MAKDSNKGQKNRKPTAPTLKFKELTSMEGGAGRSLFSIPDSVEVEASLRGGFRHGEIQVEGKTIGLDIRTRKGRDTIEVTPPTIDVEITIAAPGPCAFEFEIKINDKIGKGDGIMKFAGRERFKFQFLLSIFGL